MGGMQGFGPVIREENEPVFHEDWERKTRAMAVCLGKKKVMAVDEHRYGMERIKQDQYLAMSYYERWFYGLLIVLVEKGVLGKSEIQELKTKFALDSEQDFLDALTCLKYLPQKEAVGPDCMPETSPNFKPGDKIKTKLTNSEAHIRIPQYTRGKIGVVKEIEGNYKLPETIIYSEHGRKEPVYLVEFEASELWGTQVHGKDKVRIDLWESYLEAAND
jgi:nitrile hydratase beta subunit